MHWYDGAPLSRLDSSYFFSVYFLKKRWSSTDFKNQTVLHQKCFKISGFRKKILEYANFSGLFNWFPIKKVMPDRAIF